MSLNKSWKIALPLAALALVPAYAAVQAAAETDTYKELDALMDVFERVRVTYVDKVDDKTLIRGAINGMLSSLDPHSGYLDGRDYANLKQTTDGEYSGLGLTVTSEDGAVKVVTPTDDTPAAKAGIKAGDYVTHLDDELIYGGTLNEAVDKMRGLAGTKIKLTIVRQGEPKPLEFTLTERNGRVSATELKIEGEPLPVEERAPREPREPRAGGADFERRPSRERTPMTTGERVEGTVKFFNGTKGFGFIQRDDGAPDAFVHISAVERAGFSNLNEGQRVSFELEEDRRGKEAAVNLSAI